jgi:hypothetical protein
MRALLGVHLIKENAMKTFRSLLAVLLLLASTAPARADFKYTETSQMTGGSLLSVMKFASKFARGDAKKQEQDALAPTSTTHYVKDDRLRTDNADGTTQIIDVGRQRVIFIDNNKKTYAEATFDQIRAAMEQAQRQMQQQIQKAQQTSPDKPQPQDVKVIVTPTVKVTPGTDSRTILGQSTNETKVEIDLAMQGTATGPDAPPPGQPNSATLTYAMDMDSFVAPNVAGYKEFAEFYRRMAQEVNWMKLPAMNIQIDPRVSQGMAELQKNSDALKGFPMLSYVSMVMAATANGQTPGSQNNSQQRSTPPPSQSSSSNDAINSPSDAVIKGLGGLFGKKKDNSSAAASNNAPPANPNSNPNALIEITTQVTSFSESSLDGDLFNPPAGYMQLQEDPMQVLGGRSAQAQQSPSAR